jgi:pyruvate dehydrogenase E1 component alpha subunit
MEKVIILPDLGQTTNEARIVSWLKQPGEYVRKGEPLVTVETDKVNMDIEAFDSGYLLEHVVAEGSLASALQPIAVLTDDADEVRSSSLRSPDVRVGSPEHQATQAAGPVLVFEPIAAPLQASAPSQLNDADRVAMLRQMLLCRMFEDRVYYLFLQGRMPGTIHQAQGQEACAVGVCSALREGDMITSTHRPHAHAVARGLPVRSLMAELFAKTTGCCRGKGGSMHFGDIERGMLPAIAIVGGGIPIASGYALAMKVRQTGNIVACFFGDGATNIGAFHEGINVAAVWRLPVVFVCENNLYGASTSIASVTRVERLSHRASAYGIPGLTVDGNDVEAVHRAMSEAGHRARTGEGPTFLELLTYRLCGHSRSDPGHYRPKEEVDYWKARDPVERYRDRCISEGLLNAAEFDDMRRSVEGELDDAVAFAEASPSPMPEECLDHVFAR